MMKQIAFRIRKKCQNDKGFVGRKLLNQQTCCNCFLLFIFLDSFCYCVHVQLLHESSFFVSVMSTQPLASWPSLFSPKISSISYPPMTGSQVNSETNEVWITMNYCSCILRQAPPLPFLPSQSALQTASGLSLMATNLRIFLCGMRTDAVACLLQNMVVCTEYGRISLPSSHLIRCCPVKRLGQSL